MRWQSQHGLRWALVLIGMSVPTMGWSSDEPGLIPQTEMIRSDETEANFATSLANVSPAGYLTMSGVRDSVADHCEDLPKSRRHQMQQMRERHQEQMRQKHRGYCLKKIQCTKWWFSYISGHGPAVWVRDDY